MTNTPYAKAGTEIRDDTGKLIATLKRDVFKHQSLKISDFKWHIKRPKPFTSIHPAISRFAGLIPQYGINSDDLTHKQHAA